MNTWSQRVLPVLQLTRMALVFTALADSGCELMLRAYAKSQTTGQTFWHEFYFSRWGTIGLMSAGLYGFGMSLNDIIDRRRDTQISPHRPIPSGRIGLGAAHIICGLLAIVAISAGAVYMKQADSPLSLLLVLCTMGLIVLYDLAGKYLVAPGLIALGAIRFLHASVAAPNLPVMWHPLLLLNHVAIVSTIAYELEQKRPALRSVHKWSVFFGLLVIDALVIGLKIWHRLEIDSSARLSDILLVRPMMVGPIVMVLAFICAAIWIKAKYPNPRNAGEWLMLVGLLWLIAYDATFVTSFIGFLPGFLIWLLFPLACLAVIFMRWWGKVLAITQRPQFKRVEVSGD
jgi:hypothetical protein